MDAKHFETFLEALNKKLVLQTKINTKSKGMITREVVPLDLDLGQATQETRYHFFTLNSPTKNHYMSIEQNQLHEIELTGKHFQPSKYSEKRNSWSIPRNWAVTEPQQE